MRQHRTLAILLALSSSAHAQSPPSEPSPEPTAAPNGEPTTAANGEPTALDVEGAPLPGEESGRIDGTEDDESTARQVGRAALFVPRGLFEIAMFPVRTTVWATDRYDIPQRLRDLFFNDEGTIGLYPTLRFESGYGLNIGARLSAQFGRRDHLAAFAGTGGRFRSAVGAAVRTGDRLGNRVGLELRAVHERRPRDRFYGIGNGDEIDPPAVPIDPLVMQNVAVETRYRRQIARASLGADVRIVSDLHLRGSAALTDVERSESNDGPPIEDVFVPSSLIDFDNYRTAYGELELRWDNRGRASIWEPPSVDAMGWFASAFLGRVALDGGDDFWRYGFHVQHFYRFARGPRVIAARITGEAITGDVDEVPFTELPFLGGPSLLRGYTIERFRDRVAAVATLEYQWDLSRFFLASVFVDAGRVYSGLDDLTLDDLRVGYGIALEGHTKSAFGARVSLASSIDGGVFVNLYLDPFFEVTPRVERR